MSWRSRIPPGVKRVLIPAWNGLHRAGWRARDLAEAVAHWRFDRCAVCGRFGPMLLRRRMIPPRLVELWGLSPRQVEALARKESSECWACGAKLRARRLARVVVELYPAEGGSKPLSLADWVARPEVRALRVAEINRIEGLHEQLVRLPTLFHSDYQPEIAPGETFQGVRSEDLTRLTCPDRSFDLVLTSETLEHVPDLALALRELHRVLVPGGHHVCTVPALPSVRETFARAVIHPDGSIEHRAPRICHPGGDLGYLVFTEIGTDFPGLLHSAGFEVEVRFGPLTDDDLAQVYVCRKPG